MLNFPKLFVAAIAVASATMAPTGAFAADARPFVQSDFDAAKSAGRSILVEVKAPWCPTCKAQQPILTELTAQSKFNDMIIFDVDFDSQKDALRRLKVRMQSTLITYKSGVETGRSTGDTDKASISQLLDKAI